MKKQVIVTTSWDDGHKLDLKLAKLLKKYKIKGTFYISPENREFKKSDLLSNEEIIDLAKDFEIGAHTMTHPRLTKISEQQAFKEIIESKKYLEKLINKSIECFCYPGGNNNIEIKELVKKAGFCYARSMKRFFFSFPDDLLSSKVTMETHRNSIPNFPIESLKILEFSKFNLTEFIKNLNWEHLAKGTFDYVNEHGGIYHLWGHSWVIEKFNDWGRVNRVLSYISKKTNVNYMTNYEITKAIK